MHVGLPDPSRNAAPAPAVLIVGSGSNVLKCYGDQSAPGPRAIFTVQNQRGAIRNLGLVSPSGLLQCT
jgi:hypothetical protein